MHGTRTSLPPAWCGPGNLRPSVDVHSGCLLACQAGRQGAARDLRRRALNTHESAHTVAPGAQSSTDGACHALDTTCRRGAMHRLASLTLASLVLLPGPAAHADNPAVQRGLSMYVKKKKLDKIDTYLPPLFLAKEQLIRVNRIVESPADARQQLRSGSFSGLRENIRSVGEYVSRDKGDEQLGKKLVGAFFSELEAADFALLSASRSEEDKRVAQIQEARSRLDGTIKALDALLAELPEDVVTKSRSIADAVNSLDAEAALDEVDRGEAERLGRILS